MARTTATSRPESSFRLLILDDHELFCVALRSLFQAERGISVVGVGTSLQAGARLSDRAVPDVILHKPRLGDYSPFEVARALRDKCPGARLVFLDDAVRPVHVRIAVEVGASGYWTKHAGFSDLAEAVRATAAGDAAFCPAVRKSVVVTPKGIEYRAPNGGHGIEKLSPRELEVLVFLAGG